MSASGIVGFSVRDNRGGGACVSESSRFINTVPGAHPLRGLTFPQTAIRFQPPYSRGLVWAFGPLKESRLYSDELSDNQKPSRSDKYSRLTVPNIRGRLVMEASSGRFVVRENYRIPWRKRRCLLKTSQLAGIRLDIIRLDLNVMSTTRNSRLIPAKLWKISRYHHLTTRQLGNTLSRRNI